MDETIGSAWYELGLRNEQLDRGLREAENRIKASGQVAAEAFARPMDQAATRVRESLGKIAGALNSLSGRGPDELTRDLTKAAAAAEEAHQALRELGRAKDLDPAKARAYADALNEIGIEADQTVAELKQLQASDPRFNTPELSRAAGEIDRVGREARESANALNAMKGVRADTHLEAVSNQARGAAANLQKTQQQSGTLTEKFRTLSGAAAALGIGLGVATVLRFFNSAIHAASDLNEEGSKAQVVFGAAAGRIVAFAERADRALGQSKVAALGALGAFGNMFRTIGFADEAAADMSITMVTLASDMASFNNQDPSDMLDRLRSGLAGEAEPLRVFGVLLSEARVQAKAYEIGIAEVGAQLTEAQKVQARYALILQDTALQQGDFARTSTGLANTERQNAAIWENSLARIGAALLPLATDLANFAGEVMPQVANAIIGVIQAGAPLLNFLLALSKVWIEHASVLVPALVAVMAVRLVGALDLATIRLKLMGLAAKSAWAAVLLGLPILLEVGAAIARWGDDLTFGATAAAKMHQAMAVLGVGSKQFQMAAEEMGVSVEELATRVLAANAATGVSFEDYVAKIREWRAGTAAELQEANRGWVVEWQATQQALADSLGSIDSTLAGLPEGVRARVEEALEHVRTFPYGVSTVLEDGTTVFAGSVEELAALLPAALERADERAQEIAREIPGNIAASILEGRDAVTQAADALADAATDPLVEQARIDEIRQKMGEQQEALTTAINDGATAAASAARAEYAQLEIQLAGHLLRSDPKSQEAAGLLAKYITSNDPATQQALQALFDAVGVRYDVMLLDAEAIAAKLGLTIPEALDLARHIAENAAITTGQAVARGFAAAHDPSFTAGHQAGLEMERGIEAGTSGAYTWGTAAMDAWIAGVRSRWTAAHAAAIYLGTALSGPLAGLSPPKEGPLRYIDKWGENVGRAWAQGLAKAVSASTVLASLGGPGGVAGVASGSAGQAAAAAEAVSRDTIFQLYFNGRESAVRSPLDALDAAVRMGIFGEMGP